METTVDLKKEAIKNGLIWGIINIVIFLAVWYIAPNLMKSRAYGVITLLIGLGFAILFTIDMRKKAGGYWSFGEALWKIFVMFIVSSALVFVFTILFGKYIDTGYSTMMREVTLEQTESMLHSMGIEGDTLNQAMADAQVRMDKQFDPTFGQAVMSYGIVAIFYFLGALIFALIFKKSNPNPWAAVEETTENAGIEENTGNIE